MQARQPLDALGFQAPVVDPDGMAGALQGRVGLRRPGFAGVQQPGFRLQRPALSRPTLLRGGRVIALEPLLRGALKPVVAPFANQQVTVRVRPVPGVDRQRVGQPLPVGQVVGKAYRQLALLRLGQRQGQGHFHSLEELAVGPLVEIGRVPIGRGRGGRPGRHVPGFGVHQLLALVPAVLRFPLDVGGGRPGRLAATARAVAGAKMEDGAPRREGPAPPGEATVAVFL